MLEQLKLIRGVVGEGRLVTTLSHVLIKPNGRIYGGNGFMTMSCDFPKIADVDVLVPAVPFMKALDACAGEPTLKILKDVIVVSRGKFKARIPLSTDEYHIPTVPEDSQTCTLTKSILPALRAVRPFVSDDASRPWAMSAKIENGRAWATNNVVLARTLDSTCAPSESSFTVPSFAIDELLRMGKEPKTIRYGSHGLFISCSENVNLHTVQNRDNWPDLAPFFEERAPSQIPVTGELRSAVERLLPFVEDKKFPVIEFTPEGLRTLDGKMSAEMDGMQYGLGKFHATPLGLVLHAASWVHLRAEGPSWFAGPTVEGVFIGVRI